MSEFKGTPHNTAKVGDFAKTVLMPGDPLRAKFIAETFLEDVVCVNSVRGMLAYTGTWKGKKVSVMGHGMGIPSIGIYSFELYKFYGVENIIRIGSAGTPRDDVKILDVVLADKAYSQSTFAKVAFGYEENVLEPSFELNEAIIKAAKGLGKKMHIGAVSSGDCFYRDFTAPQVAPPIELTAFEMESFGLFANAKFLGKKAACLLTISDSKANPEGISAADRETAMRDMMVIALDAAVSL